MHRNELTPLIAAGLGVATLLVAMSTHRPARSTPLFQSGELVRDGLVRTGGLHASDVSWHGGSTTARTGEHVTVFVSDSYGNGVNDGQQLADFIAGLIHWSELGLLTAYITTPSEVAS